MAAVGHCALRLTECAVRASRLDSGSNGSAARKFSRTIGSRANGLIPLRLAKSVSATTKPLASQRRAATVRCSAAESSDGSSAGSAAAPAPEAASGEAGPAKHAFIHDFCLGITYGLAALASGLISYGLTRHPAALQVTALFGGTVLLGGVGSLRAWQQGQSSTPYILGQAVLAAVLAYKAWAQVQLTGAIFPMGLAAAVSAAMVVFYVYVILAGGNPPPSKKYKAKAAAAAAAAS
eukprot:TRINITY_DN32652_c0_g1_i1.p1 TRINITY_DN32652_c0_g1~~TRINITY_DN32652_c0_g1_i1.p1  ORF type:complete len:236 (-),score=0.97 TRINITY_DN32652_c0_g1_i1:211-918(-)